MTLWIRRWLLGMCGLVLLIVIVGGITRLTQSGLSMVDWKPLMGVIPPTNEADWERVFTAYKQFPEYQKLNRGMLLAEFKWIYFWEYLHRLIGRLIGVAFFFPMVFFWAKGALSGGLKIKLLVGFLLGGSQGVLGWYMVQSGLIYNPHVSHFRLASHLGLAFIILGYLFWLYLSLGKQRVRVPGSASTVALGLGLLSIQILFGAFVAGLHAGLFANTFPTMDGEWIPMGLRQMAWALPDFASHPVAVQFIHRMIAWVLLAYVILVWVVKKDDLDFLRHWKWSAGLIGVQFVLGVLTLLWKVPIAMGVIHQFTAALLVMAFVNSLYSSLDHG